MKLKVILFAAAIIGFVGSGCKKSWLDVNKDPNNLTVSASPALVFTNALATTVDNEVLQNELGSYWSGQWTQSSSYIFTASRFAYQFTNSDFNYFDPIYNNLEDYQYVIDNADAQGQPFFKGMAQVMKAYLFQKLVDMYGDVPFTEALKGLNGLFPKYEDQKTIYEALIPLLDEAIANIEAHPFTGTFGTYDISSAGTLGNGSRTKWKKFANTLKLRILIRQSRIPGRDAYIVPQLQKIIQEGSGFLGAGQDMAVNPGYVQSSGKQNPFYERWGYTAAGAKQSLGRYPKPTKYLFDVLKATNDTFRLKRIAYAYGGEKSSTPGVSTNPEITANYIGTPFGAPSGYTAGTTSYLGPSVITKGVYNNPLYLITASESMFLQAEAAVRYGAQVTLPLTAREAYEQGVRESFRLLGVPNADARATTLLTSGIAEADWSASPDKLKAIWMQKWLALVNFSGMEAWTEYRRTNYPPIPASAGAAAGAPVPVRLYYPNTEVGANSNTPKQASGVVFTSRLFWDVD